jgi:signal transduction histidine kinase
MIDLVILVIGVVTSASIGLFVYLRNPKYIVNKLYALLTLAFIFYPIANYLSLQTDDRLVYIRAVIFFSSIAVACLYYLVFLINNSTRLSRLQRVGIYYSVLVAALSWTPLVFKGLNEGSNPTPIPNVLAVLFLIHLVVFPAASLILLIKRMRNTRGVQRLQYIYMLTGIAPILLFAPITAFVMPIIFKNASLIGLSPIYASIFVVGIGYAIVRHRLFDIRFFAVRAAAYLTTLFVMAFALVLPVVLIFVHFLDSDISRSQLAIVVFVSVCVLYLFQSARQAFDKATSRIFFRHYYDPQKVLGRLGDILMRTAEIDALRRDTAKVLQEALKANLFNYVLFADGKEGEALAKKINSHEGVGGVDVIDVDEIIGTDKRIAELLRDKGIALAIKLRTEHEDLGYMLIGHKQSGEGYTQRDKQFLLVSAGEIAIGLQNALRFKEIEQFNLTLQQKVDEATRKLRQTNDRLRTLDQTKDDFISMASHQLRTPLTSVKGYVSMVLDGDAGKITDTQRKLLTQSFLSSQRMVYLISDLLNVSRLKTGKFIIEPVPTDLSKVIEEEVEQLTETVKSRNLELVFHKPEHFPTLMLDETKLRQVIMNFIDNAVYYTPAGGHIDVYLQERPETIEFTVVDDGIGVPRREQHHLFSKFYRAHNAKRARPDGTGLGIFMAKKVVIAQGGAIIFKSAEGKGSTFGFTFAKSKLLPQHAAANPKK